MHWLDVILEPVAAMSLRSCGDSGRQACRFSGNMRPANHKWFRNLLVSQIIADMMDAMGLKLPPTRVDIADIRHKYHAAVGEEKNAGKSRIKNAKRAA